MKKMAKRLLSILLVTIMVLSCSAVGFTASAWNAAPVKEIDLSLKLVGMMNMKIFQDNPYVANVYTSSTELSGYSLYAYKFSTTGNSIGKSWPHQVSDGPYTEDQFQSYFAADCITDCMAVNEEEAPVFMLYDLGDPDSDTVKDNMRMLGITDINEYYKLQARTAKISIGAYAGGGTAHECAITAYYRFSDDWRSYATSVSGSNADRSTLISMGIAAPNENRYFFETQESQKRLDGGDAFPGIMDDSVQQYIDHKESYSLPVWEDEDEDASWNIINPVPTCNIYSRWGTEFDKDTTYEEIKAIRDEIVSNKYNGSYTDGEWYGYTDDQTTYYDGLDIDDMIVPKNWEWNTIPYYSTKSGSTYSSTSASKSHLGYGEYCPAATKTYHDFYIPQNEATDEDPSRFLTVMVRETGTMCGLNGCGHWHSVKIDGVSTTSIIKFEPEVNEDSTVIDYGLSTIFSIDANDWVWTTDATSTLAMPNVKDVKLTSGDPENESGYGYTANGKYGTLEVYSWDNTWGNGNCKVKYTPKALVNEPDVFYYKIYPVDSDFYQPMYAKITVVPASTFYVEDNFSASDSADSNFESSLKYSGNWTTVDSSGNVIQATPVSGLQQEDNENYGYDIFYEDSLGYSYGSAHKSSRGDTLSFTFKGTGCDIVMRTDVNDGTVRYSVQKNEILSDGSMSSTATAATAPHSVSCRNNNGDTLYQLPVVSLHYDDYAYYTVTLTASTSRSVYVDGIRVYNPLGVYGQIGSDNTTMDTYYNQLEKYAVMAPVYSLIYNSQELDGSVGFIGMYDNWNEWYGTEKNKDGESTDFASHLAIGPNNEVYLAPGQSLVFNVANAELHDLLFAVEAKAVTGATAMTLSVDGTSVDGKTIPVTTNTAMYYNYDLDTSGIGSAGAIRIANTGSNVISLTNLKFSKILATEGSIYYQFIDEDGAAVSGVKVTVRNTKGETVVSETTDGTGVFSCDALSLGTYKVYISTPKGKSSVATRTVSVSETNVGETAVINLRNMDLTIGSAPEIWHSPTVSYTTTTATFNDIKTYTNAGSYTLTYTYSGTSGGSGYYSDKYYIQGTLALVVNTDGTGTYTFSGTAKYDKTKVSSKSGTFTPTINSDGSISINYVTLMANIFGKSSSVFNDINTYMPTGTSYYIQAYERADASIAGEYGEAAKITVGEAAVVTSDETATVSYNFVDESGNPISGVKVSVDGKSAYSGADGFVQISDVTLGDQTVTFTTPTGKSGVKAETLSFTPTYKSYSHTYTLRDMDLTIGSHPSNEYTPCVSSITSTTVTFTDVRPYTDAGSYKVSYVFDGSTTGYVKNEAYMKGTLDVIINSDGSGSYSFTGTYKSGQTTKTGTFTGSTTAVTYSTSGISIDYSTLFKTITGGDKFKETVKTMMPSGTSYSVTAYESKSAAGDYGDTATLIIGVAHQEKPKHDGVLTYTFVDQNSDPVQGVTVTVDGMTAVSGADGVATISGIQNGSTYTVQLTAPTGYSAISNTSITVTSTNYTFTNTINVHKLNYCDVKLSFVDEDSDPVQGVTVTVDGKTATSGSDGIAVVSNVLGGQSYTVQLTAPTGYSSLTNDTITIPDSTADFTKTYTLHEIKYCDVKLSFVDEDSEPVQGVTVTVDGKTATSGSNGIAVVSNVEAGKSYTVQLSAPTGYSALTNDTITIPDSTADFTKSYTVYEIGYGDIKLTFKDASSNPVSGVQVTIDGVTVTSDSDGVATLSNLVEGAKTATFTVPTGYSALSSKALTVTANSIYTETITVAKVSFVSTPTVSQCPSTYYRLRISNYETVETAKSITVSVNLDGTNSGYVNSSNYLNGTVTMTFDLDNTHTLDYSFNGTGKGSGSSVSNCSKNYTSSSYNIVKFDTAGCADIDFTYILYYIANNSNDFNNSSVANLISDGTVFTIKAYSGSLGSGNCIAEATTVYGNTATTYGGVQLTFKDASSNPVSGVQVTIDGATATSGSNGVATLSNLTPGTKTATFTVPTGYSALSSKSFTVTANSVYSETITLSSNAFVGTPTIEENSTYGYLITLSDYQTSVTAKSYSISVTFDGKNSGYLSDTDYLNGTVTMAFNVNEPHTVYYTFDGTGKGKYGSSAAETISSCSTSCTDNSYNIVAFNNDGTIDLDYNFVISTLAGASTAFYNASVSDFVPDGTVFTIKAFSGSAATGDCIAETTAAFGNTSFSYETMDLIDIDSVEPEVQTEDNSNTIYNIFTQIIAFFVELFSKFFSF